MTDENANLRTAMLEIHELVNRYDVGALVILTSGEEVTTHVQFPANCFAEIVKMDRGFRIKQHRSEGRVRMAEQLQIFIRMTRWWVDILERTLR